MSNQRLKVKNWFQALRRLLSALLRRFQQHRTPQQQLGKDCETLERLLQSPHQQDQVWQTYAQILSVAQKCDPAQLAQVVLQFEPRLSSPNANSGLVVGKALSFLLGTQPQTSQKLDAAWRLAQRLQDAAAQQEVQHQICLQIARCGDENLLLAKLLKWRSSGSLTTSELTPILKRFLEHHRLQLSDSWKAFFEQLLPEQRPPIHQVYALLGRYAEAADLAEAAQEYHTAAQYLRPLSGKAVAARLQILAERLGDDSLIKQAEQKLGDSFWRDEDYVNALASFQKAGDLEGVSNCHQQLGNFAAVIQARPTLTPEWVQSIQDSLESRARSQIDGCEFLEAVRLLKSGEDAWRKCSQTEVGERTQRLLSEAVKAARAALSTELRTLEASGQSDLQTNLQTNAQTNLFKRWSLIEEAAGNYLEAGLQAEKAQDHFAAALLFEKAKAFGQAIVAIALVAPEAVDPSKKAQLLEQGGDFFMAGMLYERLGEVDRAIDLYEQSGEFLRAAELCQRHLGDAAIFDRRWQDLLIKAGQVEQLAELCAAKAAMVGQPVETKVKLWRRIKELSDQGLLDQKWHDRATRELPDLEALDRQTFDQQVPNWVTAASREVLADYTDALGLDLGTSNSVVCLYNKQRGMPEVVETQRRRQIPSVFAIDQFGRELIGVPVVELLAKSPRAIITRVKREMGTNRKFRAGGQDYRAEEISARIITFACQCARDYLLAKIAANISARAAKVLSSSPPIDWVTEALAHHPPTIPLNKIVITVPAYFNEAQKQATKTAGTISALSILRLIHEPTAACLAQPIRNNKSETILVADLGAGTFDLSLLEAGDGVFDVHQIEGDNALGSADLDEILYTHFSEFVKAETGQEIPRNSQAATRLRQACEELKIELSTQPEWTIDLPYLIGGQSIQLFLNRTELERLAAPWLAKIQQTCQKIQHKPKRLLLIGGGALMPAVSRCIEAVFQQTPESVYDSITAVARGAALQAAILMGDAPNILCLDVVPFSLGIKCRDPEDQTKFDKIIPKHKTIPITQKQTYTTVNDNQTEVMIEVFQGESLNPEQNFKIGEFVLSGIPIAPAGVPQIEVKFDIDVNCLLTVTAIDKATGNQQSIVIRDSHLLTPAQTTSLQNRFQTSQAYQQSLAKLADLAIDLKAILTEVERADIGGWLARFQERLHTYEQYRDRYQPTEIDNRALYEIYRDRTQSEDNAQLALDQWGTLGRSLQLWLERHSALDWRAVDVEAQVAQFFEEGEQLFKRSQNAKVNLIDIVTTYQRWLAAIETLPINPTGDPEELAQHFLKLRRYSDAQTQFQRLAAPLNREQVELGLEIFARARQRDSYQALLGEHQTLLQLRRPDFENLNQTVRVYTDSVVWIQVELEGRAISGSGFAISPQHIATNRHVLINDKTGDCVAPHQIRVVTQAGELSVNSIHLPNSDSDDIVILHIQPIATPLIPLRLGFSELVEIGERIMTIGFPAPENSEFRENLYCNTGLINRIKLSQLCSERVLEVSIPLQGGISGAPILNQAGEVIGLLTFYQQRQQEFLGGQIYYEQFFYAIPVELLRRLSHDLGFIS
jgi:molecular chaperone DnaK